MCFTNQINLGKWVFKYCSLKFGLSFDLLFSIMRILMYLGSNFYDKKVLTAMV